MFYQNLERQDAEKCTSYMCEEKPLGSLDLYSDPQIEQFFTRGIRGGQSFIAQRYAVGSKNPDKKSKHLLYVDGEIFFVTTVLCCVTKSFHLQEKLFS